MPPPRTGLRVFSPTLVLCLAVIGTASMIYYHIGLFVPRALEMASARNLNVGYSFGNDFYQVWLTSHEWMQQGLDPYSDEMTREIQIGLYHRPLDTNRPSDPKDQRKFPYPAFVDLIFWPMAQLTFPVARVVVVCTLILLTAASLVLWTRALDWQPRPYWMAVAFLLLLSSYPVLEGLYAGQVGIFVSFLLAASILALQRGKFLLSGILMAFTTVKPQVTALAILYLVVWSFHGLRRRRHFCVGLIVTVLLLVGGALLVWPHWIQLWIREIVQYHGYTPPPLVNAFLSPLGPHIASILSTVLTTGLLVGAALLAWRNRAVSPDSLAFWLTLTLLLGITTIAVLPGQAIYDHVILLPGILLLASRWQQWSGNWIQRGVVAGVAAMLLWPWVASFSLIILHPLLTRPQFYSVGIFSLPLRMAAAFSFVVVGALALGARSAGESSRIISDHLRESV